MSDTTAVVYSPAMLLEDLYKEEGGENGIPSELQPAFTENNIAVCMVSSDEYAPFASVVIQSILDNAKDENNYDIVVLSDDMLLENQWRIRKQAVNRSNISIRIMNISDMIQNLHFYTWAHFTCKTYYRLLTPDLFDRFEKVIYLDSDIIVNHDIAELYRIDMGDNLLAAAYDTHVVSYCSQDPPLQQREYNMNTLHMEEPEKYFQAGVSIFNIKAFKKEYEPGYLINRAANIQLMWLDQDLLNMLCKGKIKLIPNRWNVMVANVTPNVDEYYLPREMRKEYFEARQAPYIIHYVGRMMPCCTERPDMYEYYWHYARESPFYEIIIQRMAIHTVEKDNRITLLREEVRQMREEIECLRALSLGVTREQPALKLHQKLKQHLLPVFTFFFPLKSKRRKLIKQIYFHIRGWVV